MHGRQAVLPFGEIAAQRARHQRRTAHAKVTRRIHGVFINARRAAGGPHHVAGREAGKRAIRPQRQHARSRAAFVLYNAHSQISIVYRHAARLHRALQRLGHQPGSERPG